eukprot:RCo043377
MPEAFSARRMGVRALAVVLVLALGMTIGVGAAKPLKGKWVQTKEQLIVSLQVICKPETRAVSLTDDTFSFKCTAAADSQDYELTFDLREEIDSLKSSCEPAGKGEVCILIKREPHWFDRLSADPNALKPHVKQDFSFHSGEEDSGDPEEGAEHYEGTLVGVIASTAKLNKTLEANELVFLDVSYPWCAKCTNAKEKFAEAARAMRKEAKFFYVDAREAREVRQRFPANCEYTCVFYASRRGEAPHKVQFKYIFEDFLKALRVYSRPLLTTLGSEAEAAAFVKSNPLSVVGNFESNQSKGFEAFIGAASDVRGEDIPFGVHYAKGSARVRLHKTDEEPFMDYAAPEEASVESLARFVKVNRFPLLIKYEFELKDKLDPLNLPSLRFWSNAAAAAQEAPAEAVLKD